MALLTSYIILDLLIAIFGLFFGFYVNFHLHSKKYWANRNIPYEEPTFFFGNMIEANYKKTFGQVTDELYCKHKDKKILGIWSYVKPVLLILDVDVLKNVLVKDFSHFHDRGITINEELEPLTAHLFNIGGQKWRNLRVKLTPTFTSGKMKMMYDAMQDCGDKLQQFLEERVKTGSQVHEVKELLASFTTEIIASCAFGLNAQALGNPDSDFRKYGRMVFKPPLINLIAGIVMFVAPKLGMLLRMRIFPKEAADFFMNAVKDVMEYRDKGNVRKKDFMDLLLQLKNKGYIEDADTKYTDNQASSANGLLFN